MLRQKHLDGLRAAAIANSGGRGGAAGLGPPPGMSAEDWRRRQAALIREVDPSFDGSLICPLSLHSSSTDSTTSIADTCSIEEAVMGLSLSRASPSASSDRRPAVKLALRHDATSSPFSTGAPSPGSPLLLDNSPSSSRGGTPVRVTTTTADTKANRVPSLLKPDSGRYAGGSLSSSRFVGSPDIHHHVAPSPLVMNPNPLGRAATAASGCPQDWMGSSDAMDPPQLGGMATRPGAMHPTMRTQSGCAESSLPRRPLGSYSSSSGGWEHLGRATGPRSFELRARVQDEEFVDPEEETEEELLRLRDVQAASLSMEMEDGVIDSITIVPLSPTCCNKDKSSGAQDRLLQAYGYA